MSIADLFVCPACRARVMREADAYVCEHCSRRFPIVLGIPDFRLAPDPGLSIEDDRAKGIELDSRTRGASFRETVEAYWAMTPTTTKERAARFIEHVLGAEARSREWLAAEGLDGAKDADPWLDLGCGTADLSAAAGPDRTIVAVDIAFRWLVVAQRRLAELGRDNVTLVCAGADRLPFADRVIGRVLSLGLLEHLPAFADAIRESARVLVPGGRLHARTTNRYSLLPEPHVNLWGVGFLPEWAASRYVEWRNGERYRYLHPTSAGRLRAAMNAAGFADVAVRAARALASDRARLGGAAALADAYTRIATLPIAGRALSWVAPLLDAHGVAR